MSQTVLQTFAPSPVSPRRERPKSRLSFMSDRSSENKPRIDLTETSKDKRRLNIFSKSNPNSAITEAEPGVRAGIEGNTLGYLRQYEHKDNEGNLIADPDRSNPTRPRLERPLDTIRSFEAAISKSYRQNDSSRAETQSNYDGMPSTRRSSTHNILDQFQQSRPIYSSHRSYQPDLRSRNYRNEQRRDYYPDNYSSYGAPSRKPAPYRGNSEPILYGNHQQLPYNHNYNQKQAYYESYDTDHTASGGSPSEPWTNSTDPSSENSSLDPHAAHMPYGKSDGAGGAYSQDPYGRPIPAQQVNMDGGYPQQMTRPGAQQSHQRPSQLNPNTATSYANNGYSANGYSSSGNTTPGASYTYANGATTNPNSNPHNPIPPAVPPKQANGYAQDPYAQLGRSQPDLHLNTQAQPVGKRGKLAKQMAPGAQANMVASRTRSHDMYKGNGPPYRSSPANVGSYDTSLSRYGSKDDGEKKKGWLRRTFSSKKR